MNDPVIATYPFSKITLAPNPRKTLHQETVVEMGRSILEHGILQPPTARLRNGQPELYMGQRRYRGLEWALQEAMTKELPAKNGNGARSRFEELEKVRLIVRDVTDEQMRFEQWVENLQREDVLPQEEAEGFYELSQTRNPATGLNYTAAEIAQAVGRAKKTGEPDEDYIKRRMKLRLAPEFFLEEVNRGAVATTTAELIGKIPDPKSRDQAAKMILKPEHQETPLNFAQAKELVRAQFMISLRGCDFDTENEKLVPAKFDETGLLVCGGACSVCPMRSGNNEDLKEELAEGRKGEGRGKKMGIDPDLCTNPSCFREKQAAGWELMKKASLAKGQQVIEGAAAKKIFSGYEGELAYDSAYVALGDRPQYKHAGAAAYEGKLPTWAKLIEGASVDVVLARNPFTNKTERLVDWKKAVAAVNKHAEEQGEKSPLARKKHEPSVQEVAARKKENERRKVKEQLSYEAARELARVIGEKGAGLEALDIMLRIAVGHSGADGIHFFGKMLGLEKTKRNEALGGSGRDYGPAVGDWLKNNATTSNLKLGYLALALLARELKWSGVEEDLEWEADLDEDEPIGFEHLAKHFDIDLVAMKKRIESEVAKPRSKAEKKGKAALKTVTRGKSAARNYAATDSAQREEIKRGAKKTAKGSRPPKTKKKTSKKAKSK